MKSRMFVLIVMFAGFLLAGSMTSPVNAQEAKAKKEMVKAKKYYCPHHPNEVSDKPGKCPVCGMAMVEMKDMGKTHDGKTMKMDKDTMKGDMKKMNHEKMMKDSKNMKPGMKEMKKDSTKMKPEKM